MKPLSRIKSVKPLNDISKVIQENKNEVKTLKKAKI